MSSILTFGKNPILEQQKWITLSFYHYHIFMYAYMYIDIHVFELIWLNGNPCFVITFAPLKLDFPKGLILCEMLVMAVPLGAQRALRVFLSALWWHTLTWTRLQKQMTESAGLEIKAFNYSFSSESVFLGAHPRFLPQCGHL